MKNLHGKVALVTGASKGIGAAIALELAARGAAVAVNYAGSKAGADKVVAEIKAAGGNAVAVQADLSSPDAVGPFVKTVADQLGPIDILVNNAGIIRREPAVDFSAKNWSDVIEINLNAVFRFCQLAGRHMLAQGSGKIINIASLLSFQGGILVPSYAAAKGAVAQLTKALANEWAAKNVNVNAIAPGYMATDNTTALRADPVRSKAILDRIPAGRWGTPQDVGGAAVFLASPASDYVTGHVLLVDGGWMAR
jgi:2-deoxy-D-gluconate 3-dehydrogenase